MLRLTATLKTKPGTGEPYVVGYTARCVNAPHFHLMDRAVPLTTCRKGDPCACAKTITIHLDQLPNGWEPTLYGSTTWRTAKGKRSPVESYNSITQYHNKLDRHSIRVHHRTWHLASLAIHIGLLFKQIFNWVKELGYTPADAPDADVLDPETIAAYIAHAMSTNPRQPNAPPAA